MKIENEEGWIETPIPGRNDKQPEEIEDLEKLEKSLLEEFNEDGNADSEVEDSEDDVDTEETEEDDVETEVEDEESENDEEDTDSTDEDEDDTVLDIKDDSDEDKDDDEDDEDDERKAYGKRAQKRIQKLAQQKNEYKAELDQLKKERRDDLESKVEAQKTADTSKKEQLEEQKKVLANQMREAMDLSDSEKFIELQEKYTDVSFKAKELESVKHEEVPTEEEYLKQNPTVDVTNEVPEEAIKWLKANREKLTALNQQEALRVSEQLDKEGWDETSPEYYSELDTRLGKTLVAFQKGKAKPKPKGKPKTTKKQTMSGKPGIPAKKKADGLPVLTPRDKQIAAEMGISEKAMQKQIKRQSQANSQYVEIVIEKD